MRGSNGSDLYLVTVTAALLGAELADLPARLVFFMEARRREVVREIRDRFARTFHNDVKMGGNGGRWPICHTSAPTNSPPVTPLSTSEAGTRIGSASQEQPSWSPADGDSGDP